MTAPRTPAVVVVIERSTTNDLDHYFCCDESTALCGADLRAATYVEGHPASCVVCVDLDNYPCPVCGE